jgi:hypothetical protein
MSQLAKQHARTAVAMQVKAAVEPFQQALETWLIELEGALQGARLPLRDLRVVIANEVWDRVAASQRGRRAGRIVQRIREALHAKPGLPGFWHVYLGLEFIGGFSGGEGDGLSYWAARLYRVGWRPGQNSERALELLASEAP